MEKHRNHRSSSFVYLFMVLRTDMKRITSENFVYFGLKLFVLMWTYKCKPSRSAKRHISLTSSFQAVMCPWAPDVEYDCCFTEPYLSDTYPK